MTLTEAKHAHFNDLKFISEINFRHNSCDISNNIVSHFYDYEDLKKTLSKFIYIINVENSALLLINYCSDFIIEIYQNFQKILLEFINIIHINSFTVSFYHCDSDSVTEFSFLSIHDNHADTSVITSASYSCC